MDVCPLPQLRLVAHAGMESHHARAIFAFGNSQWLEIKHCVDPEDKNHGRFDEVRDAKLILLDRHVQESGKNVTIEMSVGEAVDKGIIANETLGYFVARIYSFLVKIDINP